MKRIQALLGLIAIILLMQSVVPTDSQLDLVTANRILANEAIAVISPDGVIGGFLALQTSGDAVLQVGSNEAANISMRVSADGTPTLLMSRPGNGGEEIFISVRESGAAITVGGAQGADRVLITTIGNTPGAQVSIESNQISSNDALTGFRVASAANPENESVEMYITEDGGQLLTWNDGNLTGFLPFPINDNATAGKPTTWGQIKNNPSAATTSNWAAKRASPSVDFDAMRQEHKDAVSRAAVSIQR
jgi:hypothetical protein